MRYQERDHGITYIKARKNHVCYGMGIGIIVLDDVFPGFPGDVRNPSAYPFPMQYEMAKGVNVHNLVYEEDKSPCRESILQAAKVLENYGCRAIAAECGYFAYFQKDVAGYVDIPVFMSSLLQVPFIQQVIGPKKSVGIVCANGGCLKDEHLASVGIDLNSKYTITGTMDEGCREFQNLWEHSTRPEIPQADYAKAQEDMINKCRQVLKHYPDTGAFMLECTGMQPFARAIQRQLDLPVFSWGTLLDYAYSVVVHRDYYGHV